MIPDVLFDNLAPSTPSLISRVASFTLSSRPSGDDGSTHALAILGRVANDPDFAPSAIGLPVPEGQNSIERIATTRKDKLLKLLEEWTVGSTREDIDKKIEEVLWMNAVVYGVGGWGGRALSKQSSKEFNGDFFLYVRLQLSYFFKPSRFAGCIS